MEAASQPAPRLHPRTLAQVHPTRRGFVLSWWSFTVTFIFLRLLTLAIHEHVAGLGNVSAGGVHLHHYLWGILLVSLVASAGLIERSPTWRIWMGLVLGFGLALIIDEIALLVELKDVYWSGAGWVSVGVGIIFISVLGSVLAMTRSRHRDQ
jgi:hypothetical protein